MIYRQHDIELDGKKVNIFARGKKLATAESFGEAQDLIDQRWAAFPNKPLGWW